MRIVICLLVIFLCYLCCLVPAMAQAENQALPDDSPPAPKIIEAPEGTVIAREGQGWLEDRAGFKILHLRGSHYEMGRQHGVLLKSEIHRMWNEVFKTRVLEIVQREAFEKRLGYGIDIEFLKAPARKLASNTPQEYLDEIRGIADGAGIDYSDALLMSFIPDIAEQPDARYILESLLTNCSNMVAFGPATIDGRLLHARNLDWHTFDILPEFALITDYAPEQGNRFISIGFVGQVGTVTAANELGITVTEETVWPGDFKDYGFDGVPLPVLLRWMVEKTSSVDEAIKYLVSSKRNGGYHFTISDAKNKTARVVEFSASASVVRKPYDDGTLFGGGVYFDELNLYEGTRDERIPMTDNSTPSRYARLKKFARDNYGKLDPALMVTALTYRVPVSVEGFSPDPVCRDDNLHSVVFDPSNYELWVAQKSSPACLSGYLHLNYRSFFQGGGQ